MQRFRVAKVLLGWLSKGTELLGFCSEELVKAQSYKAIEVLFGSSKKGTKKKNLEP